jgi:peptidoglycan hydrolase-like protein with peptidoglycan-binding domain
MTSKRRNGDGYGAAITLAVALGAPLLLACVLVVQALSNSPLQSASPEAPVIMTIESRERDDRTATSVTVEQPTSFAVTTQSTGIITALHIVPGQPVQAGEPALEVSGAPVLAYTAAAPLFRDIEPGATGPDVTTAQNLLVDLGYLRVVDGKAGPATARAIKKFNTDHGYGSLQDRLTPSQLLWVPEDGTVPAELAVRVGATIDSGDELYTTAAAPAIITVSTKPVDADRTLDVAGANAPLPAGSTSITDPALVQSLVTALAGETTGVAYLTLTTPRTVGTVPASAVVTDESGITCYFTGIATPAVILEDPSGAFGAVDVPTDQVGGDVLANPRETRTDLSCT